MERVREWARELQARPDEVLATLRGEGVLVESVFLDSDEHGDYLVYYMKARNLGAASEAARRSVHRIDSYHQNARSQLSYRLACPCRGGRRALVETSGTPMIHRWSERTGRQDHGERSVL